MKFIHSIFIIFGAMTVLTFLLANPGIIIAASVACATLLILMLYQRMKSHTCSCHLGDRQHCFICGKKCHHDTNKGGKVEVVIVR